jgi:hypothetical protein
MHSAMYLTGLQNLSAQDLSVSVSDLKDDLAELEELFDDAERLSNDGTFPDERLSKPLPVLIDHYAALVKSLKSELIELKADLPSEIEDLLATAQTVELASRIRALKRKIITIKSSLRTAFKQRGGLLHALDRSVQALIEYENDFISQYACHLGSSKLKAYLTNSGMAAFMTVLQTLIGDLDSGRKAVGFQPMYFENMQLLERFTPELLLPEPRSRAEVVEYLQCNQPTALFLDAASNHGQKLVHELTDLLCWAKDTSHPFTIVVDTTCIPTLFLPDGLLNNLPEHVSVVILESLAKHHQLGLDLVTGGILLVHASKEFSASLEDARRRLGTIISDTSVGSLPRPRRSLQERRMARHSRNVELFSKRLEERLRDSPGVIDGVNWLDEGVGSSSYKTANVSIRLQKEYRTAINYQEFEETVLKFAHEKGQPLVLGSSFGFDVTRLFMTTPGVTSPNPFIRLSLGTETRLDILALAEVFFSAHKELSEAWQSSFR